jgi:replicative DNA helicase
MNRELPQAIEMEKALLSCFMQPHSDRAIAGAVETLSAEVFHSPANATIWLRIITLWMEKHPTDLISVCNALEDAKELEAVGGQIYIAELSIISPAAANWNYYAGIIRDKWIARKSLAIASQITEAAYGQPEGLSEAVQASLVQIAGLSETKADTKHIKDIVARRLEYHESIAKNGGKLEGLPTGIKPLDKATRGLRPGNMIVIAAETKAGKTSLALNIALNVAENGHPVGIFSLEMNEGELADRLISTKGEVDMSSGSDMGFSNYAVERITSACISLSTMNIYVRDEGFLSPLQFRASARKMVAKEKCKLLVVDYLQLMDPTSQGDSRERQVAECSRTIKSVAAELQIPIIVLSQLNDNGRSRESRAIEQDCNIFAVIESDEDGHWINLKLTRDCQGGRIPVTFRKQFTSFIGR